MANIDLGTFTFDAAKIDEQLVKLRTEMALLRDERKKYSDQEKDYNKVIDGVIKTQEKLIATGKEESDEMKATNKLLADLRKARQEVFNKNKELSQQNTKLNSEYKEATKLIGSLTDAEGKRVTSTQAVNVALEREVKSIADARASNKELLALRNQLDIAGGDNEETLKELNGALDRNNAFIKANVSAYEQQKIGIGDYQTAIENALGGTKLFGVGISDIKNQFQQFAPILNLIKTELTNIKTSFQTATASTQGFSAAQKAMAVTTAATSGALKLLRIALIATGIGAIVVVLGSLIAFLSSTQKGIDLVTSVTRPLSAVFGALVGVLQEVGEFLFEAFANPKQTISDLYNFIKDNIIVQFKAFAKILEGIFTLDFGKVKEGFVDLADNAKKNIGIVTNAVGELGKTIAEAAARGAEIDRIQKLLDKGLADFIVKRSELTKSFEEEKKISEDVNLTFAERQAAAERAIVAQNEIKRITVERLEQEKQLLILKQQQQDISDQDKADLAQKVADINKAIEEEAAKTTEAQNKVNSIRKEAHNAALAQIKERQDLAIKTNQEALDLFIAEQGFRKKSSEEQLEIARQTRDKEIEILDQELEFKRITREAYLASLIDINNDYLETERDLVIENAEIERDLLLANIEQRQTDYAAFTDEKLAIDRAAIADRLLAEQEYAQLQLEQGIINQEEFDRTIFDLKAEARESELEAQLEFETANKERALLDLENQRIIDEENFLTDFEVKKARLEQQRLAEIEATELSGASKDLINQKYALREQKLIEETAAYEKEIERQKQDAKLSQAKAVFNGISELLGKETVAGKAAAVAAAIINTFQGVTKALAEGGVIGIATGALVAATGAISIGKILSTKPPQRQKAERGMRVPKWGTMLKGRSHRQGGIPIEAEGGEAIINKRSASMFPGLLSAINIAGGGIPLAARGGIVGNVASRNANIQSRLLNDVNNAAMSESIALAVREGAMEGSMVGSQQGSQSGIIGLSENREVQRNSAF